MRVGITEDNQYLIVRDASSLEIQQLQIHFTKEPEGAWLLKKKNPHGVFKTSFFNQYGLIPFGLWLELIEAAKKYGFRIDFEPGMNEKLQDPRLEFSTFKYYIDTLFKDAYNEDGTKVDPKMYQNEGVFKLLKFRRCCVEVTTSGGKTLMAYILYKFLRDVQHIKRCLYVVPNVNLATQSEEKFDIYETWVKGDHSFKTAHLGGDMKKADREKVEKSDILFATYQSLNNKKEEFFKDFDCIIIDESHHAAVAKSFKRIIKLCVNMKYCFGVTGTFPRPNTFERFSLESYIGPLVFKLTAFELINIENFATPIYIVNDILDYATKEEKEALYILRKNKDTSDPTSGNRLLKQEQNFVSKSYPRMKYICDLAISCKHNTLILFNDVNVNKYGKKIYDYLKDNCDKNVFYADGATDTANRDYYKQCMEDDSTGGTIIVGSTGCFSEGIDVANLWTIILANSVKSEYIVRQFIGRGMRRYKGKDKVVIFDIVDDFRFSGSKDDNEYIKVNYMWKQHLERTKIYHEQKFPVFDRKVDFHKKIDSDSLI